MLFSWVFMFARGLYCFWLHPTGEDAADAIDAADATVPHSTSCINHTQEE
jgi:hypothetical protein